MDDFLKEIDEYRDKELLKSLDINMEDMDKGAFRIANKSQANYFLKLVKEGQEEIETINTFVEEEIKRQTEILESYRENQISSINKKILYFESLLEDFTTREVADSKVKSIKLPMGKLSIKKQPISYIYNNENELIEWLKTNNLNILISETIPAPVTKLNKKEIKSITNIDEDNNLLYIIDENTKEKIYLPEIEIKEQKPKFKIE